MKEKTLYRSCKNRMLGGVCGGLGEYFDIDPVLIRLIFVLLVIAAGSGFLVYLIAWVIIPEDPTCEKEIENEDKKAETNSGAEEIKEKATEFAEEIRRTVKEKNYDRNDGRTIVGLIILAFGVLFLVDNVFHFNVWSIFWPVVLIVVGLAVAAGSKK